MKCKWGVGECIPRVAAKTANTEKKIKIMVINNGKGVGKYQELNKVIITSARQNFQVMLLSELSGSKFILKYIAHGRRAKRIQN